MNTTRSEADSRNRLQITNRELGDRAHHLVRTAAELFNTRDPGLLATLLAISAGHAIGLGVAQNADARFPDLANLKQMLMKGIQIGEDFHNNMLDK